MRRTELIAYDIRDDVRRSRVCHAILSKGERLQYSVFAVSGSRVMLEQLHSELEALIDRRHDHLLVVDLGGPEEAVRRVTTWGTSMPDLLPPTHYTPW